MFPDILSVANEHNIVVNERTRNHKEVLCKCPFCFEDTKPAKKRRFYLSLNTQDQVFKCWFCGESGGVLRFISLLEGVSEEKVRARYRKRKIAHRAERLTRHQLAFIGHNSKTDFAALKKRDRSYWHRTMDWIWNDWQAFKESQLQRAYFYLLLGIRFHKYEQYIEEIRQIERVIEAPLLEEVLNTYSSAKRPAWTERWHALAYLKPVSPESNGQAGTKENVICL